MQDFDTKKKVLEEIMALMDEKEGESLKMKSPKFMAAKVEVEKPTEDEIIPEEKEEIGKSKDDMDPEMIQKILEMYQDLK